MPPKAESSPFPGARILALRETSSTMDAARSFAESGAIRGSVVVADSQMAGRGRLPGRIWSGQPGASLLCTIILDAADGASAGFPLRVGLALLRSIEVVVPVARDRLEIKWPNDLLFSRRVKIRSRGGRDTELGSIEAGSKERKLAGVLCEGSGGKAYAGVGVNLLRQTWPSDCKIEPISVEEAFFPENPLEVPSRDEFLEELILQLSLALREPGALDEVALRLHGRGTHVRFVPGLPGSLPIEARLEGLGPTGALALRRVDGTLVECASGELLLERPGRAWS